MKTHVTTKKLVRISSCILIVTIVFILLAPLSHAYNGNTVVYVTKSGECYHRDGCSYLKSSIEITLEKAVSIGYRACSRCHPPTLIGTSTTITSPNNSITTSEPRYAPANYPSAERTQYTSNASSQNKTYKSSQGRNLVIISVIALVFIRSKYKKQKKAPAVVSSVPQQTQEKHTTAQPMARPQPNYAPKQLTTSPAKTNSNSCVQQRPALPNSQKISNQKSCSTCWVRAAGGCSGGSTICQDYFEYRK